MRHRVRGKKIGRTSEHKKAMLSNMAVSLLRHGRIKTTLVKSKALRGVVEPLITRAKSDSVHARRIVAKTIRDKEVLRKLFTEIGPSFKERPGGYTQIFKIGPRANDGAFMSYIQLTGYEAENYEETEE
jgi:large subunit ribosomal protein L17